MTSQNEDNAPRSGNLTPTSTANAEPSRKPRILIAGEFSSGKTQLITGLLGSKLLPSGVVATALPPVWLVAGPPALCVVDLQGTSRTVADLSEVGVEGTLYCIASHESEALRSMDIIDTPGNSDPNMPPESWQRMLDYADVVVWCTNATQAWRQSEKSVWQTIPGRLRRDAILLVTHGDLMVDARSADRLMRRIHREAGEFFDTIMLVSLLKTQDLADIADKLEAVCRGIGMPDGVENPLVSNFSSDRQATPAAASKVPVAAEPNVVPLPAVQRRAVGDPAWSAAFVAAFANPDALASHRARRLWAAITDGLNLADPQIILAAVDTLISAIDLPKTRPEASDTTFPPPAIRGSTGGPVRGISELEQ